MKVITEERLREIIKNHALTIKTRNFIEYLIQEECQEIDTLTIHEPDLILAAEKYADVYFDDDRQDIKPDVLNAFYHGAEFQMSQQPDKLTVSKLRPMSEAPRDPNTRISVVRKGHDYFEAARFDIRNGGWQINFSAAMSDEFFEGWIPMPLYKPEQP